ncbi:MAG: efflux RND transporter periplasmic adaptor subunit, partial [Chitinophagales bacterium]
MTIQLRKFIEAFIVIVILAFVIMQFASCSSKAQQAGGWNEGPVSISTTTVALTNASYTNNYPGTVVPLNSVELRAQVSGYITGIYFQDGDRVRKGQKLYSIDAQLYTANYEQAQANLQLQETNLLKAQKDADRYHELEKNDAIAKQQVDYADAALAAAQKQVAAAQANVKSLQTGVNYTTIYAPFDGTIGISQVKNGTAVTAGVTLLNVVSTDDPMAVDFTIDQKEIYRFSLLDKKGAKPHDSTFSIRFGEKDIYPAFGKINFLDRAVDP